MKSVLIISSTYFDYGKNVEAGFKELGYATFLETYSPEPVHPFKGLLKWRYKFSSNKKKLVQQSKERFNQYIIQKYKEYQPDLVFIFNGGILFSETLDYFRTSSQVALWMFDSIFFRTECESHIDHVDAMFCFEKSDVEYYKTINKRAWFLPFAVDPNTYFPFETAKDIDIAFVGIIYKNEKRQRLLNLIIENFPHLKLAFYGVYKPYYKSIVQWLFREHRSIFKNVNIPPAQVNQLYNRSKIVVNIHHNQSKEGANPKVFEICAAGAYQICDENSYITSIFKENEIGFYRSDEEFITQIKFALQNDCSKRAAQGRKIIMDNHTFVKRLEQVFTVLTQTKLNK
ncbi:MAG: glycosyltransferase [Prolixibacteraceae bacterium]